MERWKNAKYQNGRGGYVSSLYKLETHHEIFRDRIFRPARSVLQPHSGFEKVLNEIKKLFDGYEIREYKRIKRKKYQSLLKRIKRKIEGSEMSIYINRSVDNLKCKKTQIMNSIRLV